MVSLFCLQRCGFNDAARLARCLRPTGGCAAAEALREGTQVPQSAGMQLAGLSDVGRGRVVGDEWPLQGVQLK